MAWSYFETTALDFNNSSLGVRYQDLDASVRPYTHLESFQIYPKGTLASLGRSKETNRSNALLCRNGVLCPLTCISNGYMPLCPRLYVYLLYRMWENRFLYYPYPCPESFSPQVWLYRLVCHWGFNKYKPIS